MTLKDSPLLAVLRQQKPSRKPVWFMRQAGRYLPEYKELRKQHTMLEAIRTPKIASQITLQPLKRFDLDAAIIFADILNPLIGLGVELDFIEKEGPKIFNPIAKPSDINNLTLRPAAECISYTLEAIQMTSAELTPNGTPVLGFCGAPFTLSAYLIEGRGNPSLSAVKNFAIKYPEAWDKLQDILSSYCADYLLEQLNAGASAVQIFDSWLGALSPREFSVWVHPWLQKILAIVRENTDKPIVFFSTGTSGLLPYIAACEFDAVGVDWRIDISTASKILGIDLPIQGNLDPEIFAGPPEFLDQEIKFILNQSRNVKNHIFNLGHGILPHTPIENVARCIELVRNDSFAA